MTDYKFRATAVPGGVRVDDLHDQWATVVIDRLVSAVAEDETGTFIDALGTAVGAADRPTRRHKAVRDIVRMVREWSDEPVHILVRPGPHIADFWVEFADALRTARGGVIPTERRRVVPADEPVPYQLTDSGREAAS